MKETTSHLEAKITIRELEAKNRDLLNRLVANEMSHQCLEEVIEYINTMPDTNPVVQRIKAIIAEYN